MERCKTCKHWFKEMDGRGSQITDPVDPDTYEPMEMPFEVRRCANERILFYERPLESVGAAVVDGSEYIAALLTAEDFGCVLHEAVA